ncbi:Protein of unknown function [Pseudosulfitobacter pseudonitzschiae]|uniref:DUF2798 domain-containing protein n=1 Tax=Pseudosulfitobacter pseudonitzschiae TaxID=1402135 RepID=A0A073J5W0_9RHOB|nr:DUF2798 domain-containing protein [Pseudosulfitobacter pseudonitzschiae]KEJ97190.1 hypothetical protein SUH3_10470 [Pseudosulfitobacter pseudonitzschiae]QKS10394.1 DUF2798 domain-containing protein [Pseudosulfitobacter pseudonitzschiae]SHF53430.1 Protein of unknown function [Pseudosulfitobacter pseudonitzschiae]
MIPARYAHIAFGFFLSGMMSLIVSGISMLRATDVWDGFLGVWMGAWLTSWAVAFPVVLFVAPLARRMVMRLTVQG